MQGVGYGSDDEGDGGGLVERRALTVDIRAACWMLVVPRIDETSVPESG